jgi:hypothetical protein
VGNAGLRVGGVAERGEVDHPVDRLGRQLSPPGVGWRDSIWHGLIMTIAAPAGRNPGDVWSVPTRPCRGPHYAAYPIELPLKCIAAGCKPGGMMLDPFAGTGTTGLAALHLGRDFTGIDLNPDFVALAAGRLRHAGPDGNDAADGASGNQADGSGR